MKTAGDTTAPIAPAARWRLSSNLIIGIIFFALAALLPLAGNNYWTMIGTRAAVYWVLISGLNLMVGFTGQLAVGYVGLLTLGAYTASVLASGNIMPALPAFVSILGAIIVCAVFTVIICLPALRLTTFYFAIVTLGFATIIRQIALAWANVTGGGIGIPGPALPLMFATPWGLFYLSLVLAALCTLLTANIARSRFGRSLIALRDVEVTAAACGINKLAVCIAIYIFAGAAAGIAGGLFASLQTYITPGAFTFNMSVMFFVTVLIGGRSSIAGPLIATIVLTVLPAIAAPLAQWSDFLYAVLLLVIVITAPGGIAALLRSRQGKVPEGVHELVPQPAEIKSFIHQTNDNKLILKDIELSFGGLKALDGVDLQVEPGRIHGLIGPNGSGKTTLLNVISGYYYPQRGRLAIGDHALPVLAPRKRAMFGLARTFQTPHVVGEISVLDNVMIGGSFAGKATLAEAMLSLPRSRREEQTLRKDASRALYTVGIGAFAETRTDRLQHSELRFLEIARALVLNPRFLLLDEPAAGLSAAEIRRLSEIVRAIRDHGIGVLLVEHHADLIFDICDQITVLNEGQVLARGTPDEIRDHKEVVDVYLGG